jgi:IS30 family transposase
MRKTLMLDNGKEFSQFKQVEEKTGFCVYSIFKTTYFVGGER